MTRINTNVPSLIAQTRLARSNEDLQTSLTRLSTGLRINSGADDPAGLIASEALRSEITGLNKAISNTKRASQIISTADSALGQVSSLLNDIRGLVVEAANNGALSPDEIGANQLQIDSSLEAINRIAQTTTFQGRKLLDGSLDFVSDVKTKAAVTDAQIDQANLGATGSINVDVTVEAAATKAELTSDVLAADNATATLSFAAEGTLSGTGISVIAAENSADFDGIQVNFEDDNSLAANTAEASYDADSKTITVKGNSTGVTEATIATAIDGLDEFSASTTAAATTIDFDDAGLVTDRGTLDRGSIEVTAATAGMDFNEVEIVLSDVDATGEAATYDSSTKTLTLAYDGETDTLTALATEIGTLTDFDATATNGANIARSADAGVTANTGYTGGEVLKADVVFELVGTDGSESFNFKAGTTGDQIAAAINLVSDSTGVAATYDSSTNGLTFNSSEYGTKGLVAINVISEGEGGTFEDDLSGIRSTGTDIDARVNGVIAKGDGTSLSINTATLDLSLTLDPASSDTEISFSITGGGALFQLGSDVVSNQQARLGIGSVSTSSLGGDSGRLYELGSGQDKSLVNDAAGAAKIVDDVIKKVTNIRGRLGAFQSTTLESNLVSLSDTVANLQEAESSIRDADFAAESAKLTRAQILVQSGTNVLAMANQNPQSVLSLLR